MIMQPGDTLPLWDEADAPTVERVDARPSDSGCLECPLHTDTPTGQRCLKPVRLGDGSRKVLVVGSFPTGYESEKGQPFLGEFGRRVRRALAELEDTIVVFDVAVKCPPGQTKIEAGWVDKCRPYFARSTEFYTYDKIVLFGREASIGYLGRYVDTKSSPNAWAWSWLHDAPVYIFPGARACIENPGLNAKVFERLEQVLTEPNPPKPPFDAVMRRVDRSILAEIKEWCPPGAAVGVDFETSGRFYDLDFEIVSAATTDERMKTSWVWFPEDLVAGTFGWKVLKKLMSQRALVAHNRNYELQSIAAWFEIEPSRLGYCTQMKQRLINGNARVALEHVQNEVGMGGSKNEIKPLIAAARAKVRAVAKAVAAATPDPEATLKRDARFKDPDTYSYGLVDPMALAKYNARDTITAMAVHRFQRKTEPTFVTEGWDSYVRDLTNTCTYMERIGLPADRGHARQLQAEFGAAITAFDAQLLTYADINWDSSKQLSETLYGKFNLPVPWKTEKGAPSTDKHALAKLRNEHPVVPLVLDRRRVHTLNKSYAWGIERFIQDDGRVHTSLKPHGTETGRLASSGPNQQNTPRSSDPFGKMVKNIYYAPKGKTFLVFDHGAIEIRMAAGQSQDPAMLGLLKQGVDFHLATAAIIAGIFDVDPATLHKDHWLRDAAKTLYFALLYGKGDATAAEDLDVEVEVAAQVRGAILGANKRLDAWMKETVEQAKKDGGVWVMRPTPTGLVKSRFRPLPEIRSRVNWKRAAENRRAINTSVQGGAAEVNNSGMVACYKWLRDNSIGKYVEMPLAVHDSTVFLADNAAVAEVLYTVPRLMTQFDCGVPLAVDAMQGDRLGNLERVKLDFGGI